MLKKILFVHHTPEFVGSARSLFYLLKELDRTKYEPVVSLVYDGPVRKRYEALGIKVYHVPFTPIWEAPSPYWYNFKNKILNWLAFLADKRFENLLLDLKPDIVHLNDTACLSAGITARNCGIPVVTHVRSVHRLKPLILQARARFLVEKINEISTAIIAIGEEYAIQFGESPKVKVVYNSLDFSEIESARGKGQGVRTELGISGDDIAIGMIGSLTKHKGAWDFIEACGIVNGKLGVNNIKFLIIGNVPDATALNVPYSKFGIGPKSPIDKAKLMAENSGISDKLLITGHRKDIYNIMDAMDIIVFPTRLDATGRPVFEGQALGKPVIAVLPTKNTRVMIDGKTGIITMPLKPADLASAMTELVLNRDKRRQMGEEGRKHSDELFRPEINIVKIHETYQGIKR